MINCGHSCLHLLMIKLYGDADFIFTEDLCTNPQRQKLTVPALIAMVTPANWPDLTLTENLWTVVKRNMRHQNHKSR